MDDVVLGYLAAAKDSRDLGRRVEQELLDLRGQPRLSVAAHLIRHLALNDDLVVALRRLADARTRREALREELGRLLQIDACTVSAEQQPRRAPNASRPCTAVVDLRFVRSIFRMMTLADSSRAAAFCSLAAACFSFFAESFANASRCSTDSASRFADSVAGRLDRDCESASAHSEYSREKTSGWLFSSHLRHLARQRDDATRERTWTSATQIRRTGRVSQGASTATSDLRWEPTDGAVEHCPRLDDPRRSGDGRSVGHGQPARGQSETVRRSAARSARTRNDASSRCERGLGGGP